MRANLKCADVSSSHIKNDDTDKSNYRPVSLKDSVVSERITALSLVFDKVYFTVTKLHGTSLIY